MNTRNMGGAEMSARENFVLPALRMGKVAIDSASCFHCGLPVLADVEINIFFNGRQQPVCCVGCEAVANTIINAGLGNYYSQRTVLPGVAITTDASPDVATFDLPVIESQYADTESSSTKSAALYIDGVTCSACLWLAETTLRRIPGVTAAEINYITHRADVVWQEQQTSLAAIIKAILRVGLGATPIQSGERQILRMRTQRESLKRLGVALLSMMQVMMFTIPIYLTGEDDISHEALRLMQWASLVMTLPVVMYSAQPFWRGARRDWRTRHISMDSPVALAIAFTFLSSVWAIFSGQGALYFDSISMFVFLLLASRYLEANIGDRSLRRIEQLTNARPATAQKLAQYPQNRQASVVASAALNAGDVILIPSGANIAADSVLIEYAGAFGEIDESIITGESMPVVRHIGDALIGGTLNLGAPLIARVVRVGEASVLASIARLAERSLGERPTLQRLTDRVASALTPALIILAVIAGIGWWFIDRGQSFNVMVAVLAVTCPCAIALAAPLAYASATLTVANSGVLIARGRVLEILPQITDVVFDKTGTLTTGKLEITRIQTRGGESRRDVLAIALALELGSAHPVAKSIQAVAACEAIVAAPELRLIAGKANADAGGVAGEMNGNIYRFGHRAFACGHAVSDVSVSTKVETNNAMKLEPNQDDAFVLSCNAEWLSTFHTDDNLKPDAAAAIKCLQDAGLVVHLVSGDRASRVNCAAKALGIDRLHTKFEQTPVQKLRYLNHLRSHGAIVAMIGDGVNDAPVLGAADLSIAMSSGADLPRQTADAILLSPHLSAIPATFQLAQRCKRIIEQNFAWAILYNAIGIPLALANLISPATAAIGMGASGLIVVLNSMRLLRG